MTTILLVFIVAFAVSLLGTRVSISLALSLDLVDRPDGRRKTHGRAVPRLGGPAIFLAFFVPLLLLILATDHSAVSTVLLDRPKQLAGIFVGAALALMLGLLDDRFDLRARWKLLSQLLIGFSICAFGFTIPGITNPFGGTIMLGVFAYPITVFWVVACMNAVNLVDGMDGLAAGICLFVGLTLFFLSLQLENVLGLLLMGCFSGAILGFLVFNFPPAKIFLGDSGSMLLGFLIAALSLIAGRKAEAAIALFIPIVALGLPVIDTGLAIVRRWYKKLPLSSPDREHIHHVLVAMGMSQRRAVLILYCMSLFMGFVALIMTFGRSEIILLVVIFLFAIVYISLRIFGGMRFRDLLRKLSQDSVRRERSAAAMTALDHALSQMHHAGTLEDMWGFCFPVFECLGFTSAKLVLHRGLRAAAPTDSDKAHSTIDSGDGPALHWHAAELDTEHDGLSAGAGRCTAEVESADCCTCCLSILDQDSRVGRISVRHEAGMHRMVPEAPDLLNRLRDSMGTRLAILLKQDLPPP